MLTRFDHIIKNALENLVTAHTPDWEVFYDLWSTEEILAPEEDLLDSEMGDALKSLDYSGIPPAWPLFEDRLDALNEELDLAFDEEIGQQLESLTDRDWSQTSWDVMSLRLDELNVQMDLEFDEAMGHALQNLPEHTWKEQHWQMLSSRLERLNDRPRLILMKVVEMAAIILLLIQLTHLYTGIQHNRNTETNFATHLRDKLMTKESSGNLSEIPASAQESTGADDHTEKPELQSTDPGTNYPAGTKGESELAVIPFENQSPGTDHDSAGEAGTDPGSSSPIAIVPMVPLEPILNSGPEISLSGKEPQELKDLESLNDLARSQGPSTAPPLDHDPKLIAYSYTPTNSKESSPRLGLRDLSVLSVNSTDSILSSIPTLQVIRPRIHSSIEVGMLADATNVEIQDYLSLSGPFNVPTLSPGGYFRYKIQYENIFGALGGDYVKMRYDGLSNDNEVTMVSLPLELGYNVVNLSSFRMYFSGGIAGRFVPVASYSTENFNQASTYVRKSQKPSNGLLKNGPFEINSYLSGRLSMGLDININKKTSISLRYSHDVWLKGRGIGYNHDKFRSSHLAIGTNFHF